MDELHIVRHGWIAAEVCPDAYSVLEGGTSINSKAPFGRLHSGLQLMMRDESDINPYCLLFHSDLAALTS